jgi:response regulator RpfG family c-di-GMP phosphodiesterase
MSITPKILLIANKANKLTMSPIVDSDKFRAKVEGIGYACLQAFSFAQGIEIASAQQPHLIVLEHEETATFNALELCRQLKAFPLTAAIPILVYSRISNLEDLNSAYLLGASFYLCLNYPHKPNENLSELFDSCLRILDNQAIELKRRNSLPRETTSHSAHGIRLSPVYN